MQEKDSGKELLARFGFAAWNKMQEDAMAVISKEKEVLLLAPTGSGKTIAFLRPIAGRLRKVQGIQCMILVPSRELGLQIEQVWKQMNTGFKVNCFYGGHDMNSELQSLSDPPAILVGTPGRIRDHLERRTFETDTIRILVLDEFDKSLALGFEEEMSAIIGRLRKLTTRVLVSATASIEIPEFAVPDQPVILDYTKEREEENRLSLKVVRSPEKDKIDTLCKLLSFIGTSSTIIFCNHREAVERTSRLLEERGIEHAAFHGGMEQMQREQTLVRFRNGSVYFLVATDLAARGLDIPEVRQVIHYHLPSTMAEFTHRNGRTARMQAEGTAYIILSMAEEVPKYIDGTPETIDLPDDVLPPGPSDWTTIFINAGRKDKINKVDIVGFFSQAGKLNKEELGMIEIKDHVSFAAVRKNRVKDLLQRIAHEKIKGRKCKIAVAR